MTDNERAASDEPIVADPERAGATEQTGGSGTGTPGSSNIAGQKDTGSGGASQGTTGTSGREGSSR